MAARVTGTAQGLIRSMGLPEKGEAEAVSEQARAAFRGQREAAARAVLKERSLPDVPGYDPGKGYVRGPTPEALAANMEAGRFGDWPMRETFNLLQEVFEEPLNVMRLQGEVGKSTMQELRALYATMMGRPGSTVKDLWKLTRTSPLGGPVEPTPWKLMEHLQYITRAAKTDQAYKQGGPLAQSLLTRLRDAVRADVSAISPEMDSLVEQAWGMAAEAHQGKYAAAKTIREALEYASTGVHPTTGEIIFEPNRFAAKVAPRMDTLEKQLDPEQFRALVQFRDEGLSAAKDIAKYAGGTHDWSGKKLGGLALGLGGAQGLAMLGVPGMEPWVTVPSYAFLNLLALSFAGKIPAGVGRIASEGLKAGARGGLMIGEEVRRMREQGAR